MSKQREALEKVRDRFFPANQPERDRDILWDEVNEALAEQYQIVGWWFHYPGADTSADWVEFGADKPSQDGHEGTVLVPIYTHPAPANQPSVPDKLTVSMAPTSQYAQGWNDCVDAMLAAAPEAPAWQELSKAERKPLTDEQIAAGRRAPWGVNLDAFTAGVRFAESAHEI